MKDPRIFSNHQLMLSGVGINYYFGLAGVYMRRMELDKASDTLHQVRTLLETQHIHVNITDITLNYHVAELHFLSGDAEAGTACVKGILSAYSSFNVLSGRLIHELDCADRLPTELADEFLEELDRAKDYQSQPFFKLLRARLLFKRGNVAEAFRQTEEVLTFSRLHKNRLHLVDAGLLKVLLLLQGDETEDRHREILNLLREAVHYAHDNQFLMPFYLNRVALLPLMPELSARATGKNSLTKPETAFLHHALTVCGYSGSAVKEPDSLSARELEVLTELSLGITNREIADKLCISQATVKTHVLSIYGKLVVSSRMLAVQEGRTIGLIR